MAIRAPDGANNLFHKSAIINKVCRRAQFLSQKVTIDKGCPLVLSKATFTKLKKNRKLKKLKV